MTGSSTARSIALAALVAAFAGVAALLLFARGEYTITAPFPDAGRLVKGGEVQVAGRKVGTISKIALSRDSRALVTLKLTDDDVYPLPKGTRASIRQVGAATLANNFVDLHLGARTASTIPDGGRLAPEQVDGTVDLDAILSSLDPKARTAMQRLIARSSDVFAGSGAPAFNGMLRQLDPATAAFDGFVTELRSDRARIATLIRTAADATSAIRGRRGDLRAAVVHTARGLDAIAAERASLVRILDRAPAALRQGRMTLADIRGTVQELRPALRQIPPSARPLGPFLREARVAAARSPLTIRPLLKQMPDLRRSMRTFVPLAPATTSSLRSLGTTMHEAQPIVRGLRHYGSDFIIGIFNGLLSIISGNYNKAGHYAHVTFAQPFETLPGGLLNPLTQSLDYGLFDIRTKLVERCPGGANPPAPDGSSPVIVPDLCNPAHNVGPEVNKP